jgi:TonB family protein
MANLFCGGWTDSALKNALASFGLSLLLFLALVSPATAQVERVDRPNRKVVRTSEPDYPKIVKHAHIGGSVRLHVTVLANGDVAKVEILGGNPIFAESATKAVLKWKFAPAASQTKEEVQINFTPD